MQEEKNQERFSSLCRVVPQRLCQALARLSPALQIKIQEIRMRTNAPLSVCIGGVCAFLLCDGTLAATLLPGCLLVTQDEVYEAFRAICGYSVHAHQAEIRDGYVTLQGGHRVGLAGSAVQTAAELTGMRDISSLNIRVAQEVCGCAESALKATEFGQKGVLLAGPPNSGKTTILRDLARLLSTGGSFPAKKVTLLDERGELASVWNGIPQNDVGPCTDVLSGYTKEAGIAMAVRALSPDFIICDEIGRENDWEALYSGALCGVKFAASIHASTAEEVQRKPLLQKMVQSGAFQTALLLEGSSKAGKIKEIIPLGRCENETAGPFAAGRLLPAGR